ncbi:hypothetical protein SAMN05421846_1013 [Chryseobacterium taeanense]|uniref:Uncharacterized protein n=1 Tax=Chryseobacterium taeanense TaxID=311334 RepID=A0A1G8D0J2_9FLAO|nr:hypothetical protein SAMN05421846_1013 [Chryseobacterium taeanense]
MRYYKTSNIFIKSNFLFLLFLSFHLKSQRTLTVDGTNWSPAIPSITEAGNDYSGVYESLSNQIYLNASIPLLLASGKISVHYEAISTWNSSFILQARRTGNGTTTCLLCSISGGTSYTTIPSTDVELFQIQAVASLASYSNIPVQLKLSGISVTIPATSYSSRIVFTISAL